MIHVSNVYFISYNPTPTGLGTITVTLSPPNKKGTHHDLHLTSATLVPHGIINFNSGDYVRVKYDGNFILIEMRLVVKASGVIKISNPVKPNPVPTTKSRIDEIIESLDKIASKTPTEPAGQSKALNLCARSVMHVCSATRISSRHNCKFYEKSLARINDCMYFRKEMGNACDCVAAHIDLTNNIGPPDPPKKKEVPEQSWDKVTEKFLSNM